MVQVGVEIGVEQPLPISLLRRMDAAERLIAAIEDELGDAEITDELRLVRIGERVANYRDDVEAPVKSIRDRTHGLTRAGREPDADEVHRMAIELPDSARGQLQARLEAFGRERLDIDLGLVRSGLLLEFVLDVIGPTVYNHAIEDAEAWMQTKLLDMAADLHERPGDGGD